MQTCPMNGHHDDDLYLSDRTELSHRRINNTYSQCHHNHLLFNYLSISNKPEDMGSEPRAEKEREKKPTAREEKTGKYCAIIPAVSEQAIAYSHSRFALFTII